MVKRKDRGALFIRSNLELLGFGTRRDALVQTVKELFENALDATQSLRSDSWDDAPLELLRISVKTNGDTGNIDVVCADTGSGMHAHQIKLLCCNAFETTKASAASKGRCTSGKFGVGLKAAMLYSQLHTPDACLNITTTSKSNGILHVQLRIDPDSEETAVVRKVAHFVVHEEHHEFSGTEMRLSIPCPKDLLDVESAADVLALYFQSLRYTAPPFVGVEFKFDVAGVATNVDCQHQEEPIDRFVADLGASADDILYAHHDDKLAAISCVALMLGDRAPDYPTDIEMCLLRYANHAPLVSGDDIFLCGITKGVSARKLWNKYGRRCQRTSSHLLNQLVATPVRVSAGEDNPLPVQLVLAIDICVADSTIGEGIKYGSLKKSTLDACYADGVQACCREILQQLVESGKLCTPQQQQDQDLIANFAPLIAKSVASIASRAKMTRETIQCVQEDAIIRELQDVLLN
ncbi:hypothetical protein PHYBOEH_005036 [Phytophthora boehmeriae]|uniref:Histidine kinase/HSP90-like ATPase domain-containing protein n=1 Tax=Phytophthora boehmeriae TaxID=109152 RepID=A0A8T1WPU0_9STRA|nr:hypothetical protein PHYBOEH_005036 [Phytophthora boehmeriae]